MRINRKNYESYFLDYLEGLLDPSLMGEMTEFLRKNPNLNAELEDFEALRLQADTIAFKDKEQLKKSTTYSGIIHDQNFNKTCIAQLEGDLSPDDEKVLIQFMIDHPEKQKEFEIFQKAKLQPQPVIFPDKRSLKRRSPVVFPSLPWYAISAAASILLIVAFSFILNKIITADNELVATLPPETEERSDEISVESNIGSDNEAQSNMLPEETEHESEIDLQNQINVAVIAEQLTETPEEQPDIVAETTSLEREPFIPGMKPLIRKDIAALSIPANETVIALKMVSNDHIVPGKYLTVRELIVSRLKGEESRNQASGEVQDKLTFLDIADASVRGISKIPGVNMKLDRRYSQNGQLSSFAFTSRNLSFTRDVKNKGTL